MKKENSVIKLIALILSLLLVLLLILVLVCSLFKKDDADQEKTPLKENGVGQSQTQILEVDVTGTLGEIKDGLNINKGTIEGVPVIEYFDTTTGTEDKPVILLLHGLNNSKETYEFMGKTLAQEGYLVITPDARLHGERAEGDSMWIAQIVTESSKDLDSVLECYAQQELADMDKLCLVGFSLGGLMTYDYLVNGAFAVDAAVVAYATPNWHELKEDSTLYYAYGNGRVSEISSKEKEDVKQFLVENSPYDEVVKMTDISLGLVNGGKDEVFTCEGTEKLYQELLQVGGDVSYCFREEGKHEFTDDDVWLTFFFIVEKLK
ncbi:MAG: alpha/beta fold hydrolase [Lachnospiraceae bacterium]|nr:alpha/beta fold hydrolase [Lachnospiraceae bacterium]